MTQINKLICQVQKRGFQNDSKILFKIFLGEFEGSRKLQMSCVIFIRIYRIPKLIIKIKPLSF